MSERKKLAIIDGKSVFYRGYYAMPNLTAADGTPTGGVYGFATLAIQLMKQLKPDYVAVAWDKPKTNIRSRLKIYPKYKAGRKPPPEDFYAQIPVLHELLAALGWPLYELDDYEADDIMATLARQADDLGVETELVTSDLDALQAISDLTHVYILKKGLTNIERFHPESFQEKYGIRVDQFLDLKSLKGDSSDNIPGVAGIGEKTALELLKQYETLDGVYENTALIKDTTAKKLELGKESAYMSKEIATLWTDAPVTFNEAELDGSKIDVKALKDLLEKLEFRTLIRQLPDYLKDRGDGSSADDFTNESQTHDSVAVTVVTDGVININSDTVLAQAYCTGAHGKDPAWLLVSDDRARASVVHTTELSKAKLHTLLTSLSGKKVIGHDTKQLLKVFIQNGVEPPEVAHDVHLGAFLLNPLLRSQDLGSLLDKAFGFGSGIDGATTETFPEFAEQITTGIWTLTERQQTEFEEYPKFKKLAHDIEWPIITVLARMEVEGIELDSKYLNEMSAEFEGIISDIEQEIYGHADQEFNISSPAQLSKILFEDMELPTKGIKKGKTAYSTAAGELDKLRFIHPIINLITQYREYTKLKSTYVDALPKLVDERSRLHTTFNLTIAQTGRLSSTDPNLQNIPVRTEIGKKIRDAFKAGEGKVIVSADYSQFELRLAAALANDTELIELFNQDADIHTETAAQVYGIKPHEVTPDQRRHAKVINFGILYGMSVHGLSVATGMDLLESKEFLEKYKGLRSPIFAYTQSLIEMAKKDGYVETIFGRRRPMPDIHSSNFIVRSGAERAAMNMPIQGTEADLMKMAMIAVDTVLPDGAKQLLQIHDSIMVECDESQAEEVEKILVDTMENIYTDLPVKLKVDVKTGKTWGDL
ncbi:DNA polymerase I [Candidatus Saccharibacteria bacterium]|nr:DNA polymerase I [Candidatus Saccharibacteria bacterium]